MKCLTIVGARPQFIKASALSKKLSSNPQIQEVLLHTGQHYDVGMSEIFFAELGIRRPDYNLGVGSGSHGLQTGKMLMGIEAVLQNEKPDWVIVYGDTNSTLAGALAAAKLHIPIAHVEAGLRSWNRKMPEEINRVLTDHTADILFAPTKLAVDNLVNEGIDPVKIFLVGDVMYDVALQFADKAEQNSQILDKLNIGPKSFILATIHRAENTDNRQRLEAIFRTLILVSKDIPIVLPLHPRTRNALEAMGLLNEVSKALSITEPVGYLDMVALEKNARLILTDSGGIQKEAFFYRVPCGILREETEWQELVDLGCNRLISLSDVEAIQTDILQHLEGNISQLSGSDIYGDGHSSDKILDILLHAGQ
ncbi:MAG: non-hydrolyzing UDP-N-acetylglucosamine 2-epimerase [Leptolyngbyaceae cyanobacterium]